MNDTQDKTVQRNNPQRIGFAWKYRLLKDGTLTTWNPQDKQEDKNKGEQDR